MSWSAYNPLSNLTLKTSAGDTIDRGFIAHYSESPVAKNTNGVLAATALTAGAQAGFNTGITNPDVPRALSITGGQAGQNGVVTIHGTNEAGVAISESITSNGVTTVDGAKAFKTVTAIDLPAQNAGGDTIAVGVTETLGLPFTLPFDTTLATALNKVRESNVPTVLTSATAVESNTIKLVSALDGNEVDCYFVV